ncbi:hypothetical protein KSH_01115 [Moraxella osloensis]|nr:hypothetical protein [Moraxella osloensis]ATQ84524.1 hypothetical protein KSH_01115 [Moraxella osloensis]
MIINRHLIRLDLNNLALEGICTALNTLTKTADDNTALILAPLVDYMTFLLESNDEAIDMLIEEGGHEQG